MSLNCIITECSYIFFQVGNHVGLYLMEELCLTMTLKKMPGKVARAASKYQFVKYKVCTAHRVLTCEFHFAMGEI